MARPAGLEPAAFCLEDTPRCAISLLVLGSAYFLHHGFARYSAVIGLKLDSSFGIIPCPEDPSGRYLLGGRVAADLFLPNAARLPWARTDRLQQLHSFLWLLCVFSNLGNLLFAQR
jgi:hypothetical protein